MMVNSWHHRKIWHTYGSVMGYKHPPFGGTMRQTPKVPPGSQRNGPVRSSATRGRAAASRNGANKFWSDSKGAHFSTTPGWWLVDESLAEWWDLEIKHEFGNLVGGNWLPFLAFSQKYWESLIIPIDELIFFRGVAQPPTRHCIFNIFKFEGRQVPAPTNCRICRVSGWYRIFCVYVCRKHWRTPGFFRRFELQPAVEIDGRWPIGMITVVQPPASPNEFGEFGWQKKPNESMDDVVFW